MDRWNFKRGLLFHHPILSLKLDCDLPISLDHHKIERALKNSSVLSRLHRFDKMITQTSMISQCVSYLCNWSLIGVIRDFWTFSEIILKWIDKIGRDGCGFERMKEEVDDEANRYYCQTE